MSDSQKQVLNSYLTFKLGGEMFASHVENVIKILEMQHITEVPRTPPFMKGVINLRGAVVPVIDLKSRFGRTSTEVGKKTCIVIFDASRDGEKTELGLMVDAVSEVIEILPAQIEPPPQFGTSIQRDFIRGMGKVDGEFIVILEPERALDIDDMAHLVEKASLV